MAHNHASTLFLAALLLSAAASPSAHGARITLNGLTVGGQLCCTPTGNCPGQGVGGAPVQLNCTNIFGQTTTAGQTITNTTGSFNITVPLLSGLILGLPIIPCTVSVHLPLEGVVCPMLSTATGFLSSAVQSAGTVVSSVLGLLQNATITGFSPVRV